MITLSARSKGFTLLEVMVASLILLIGIVAVMQVFTVAVSQNRNHGELATRVTEYSQDKMEQLMGLAFTDASSNTTVRPMTATGGPGLGVGGSVVPGDKLVGYVDYLDEGGNVLPSSAGASYIRQWSISTDATGKMKTITVYTTTTLARGGPAPSTTLVCYKTAFS